MSETLDHAGPPNSVMYATALIAINAVIGILLVDFRSLEDVAQTNDVAPAEVVGSLLLGFFGLLLLVYLSFKGWNWARILLLVIFLAGLIPPFGGIRPYVEAFETSTIHGIGVLVSSASWAAAMVLYFLPNSNSWYREVKVARDNKKMVSDGRLIVQDNKWSNGGLLFLALGTFLILVAVAGLGAETYLLSAILVLVGLILVKVGIKRRNSTARITTDSPDPD